MKLVQQAILVFQAGTSEKVYEVDLCEVGPGRFVVNFRYGKRGGPLKDGSKTVAPVSRAEAQEAFDKLVESKREQGYEPSSPLGPPSLTAPAVATVPSVVPPVAASIATQVTTPVATPVATPTTGPEIAPVVGADASLPRREQRILERILQGDQPGPSVERAPSGGFFRNLLRRAQTPRKPKRWTLERAIWRAGELRIAAAVPHLIRLFGTIPHSQDVNARDSNLRDYCIVAALGRCGGAEAVRMLERIHANPNLSAMVRRMAAEALRLCLPEPQRSAFLQRCVDSASTQWPTSITDALLSIHGPNWKSVVVQSVEGDSSANSAHAGRLTPAQLLAGTERLSEALNVHLASNQAASWAVLEDLYLLTSPVARAAVLAVCKRASFRPSGFQRVRHLFKAAEYRRDAELFGLLAWRLEKTRAAYRSPRRHTWVTLENGTRVRATPQELASPQSKLAYGSDTRLYLRGRVWRTLRRLGRDNSPDYVPMAVGVLLPFTDADGEGNSSFNGYWAFNHVLAGRGRRLEPKRGTRRFTNPVVRRGLGQTLWRGEGEALTREEAFPQLWEQQPAGLLMLLDESRCQPVHAFAARIFRTCAPLRQYLDDDVTVMLLTRPYEVTAQLAWDVLCLRMDPLKASWPLLIAAAHCVAPTVRTLTHVILKQRRAELFEAGEPLAQLLTGAQADTRAVAHTLVREQVQARGLSLASAQVLVARLLAQLFAPTRMASEQASTSVDREALSRDISATLEVLLSMPGLMLGEPMLLDLLKHPQASAQLLGARLVLQYPTLSAHPPDAILQALLSSPFEAVRRIAVTLFSRLSDEILGRYTALVIEMLSSPLNDIRDGMAPVMARLMATSARRSPQDAAAVMTLLLHQLLKATQPEVQSSMARLLLNELSSHLMGIEPSLIWTLLESKSHAVRDVGGQLLRLNLAPEQVSIERICRMASDDVLSVRQTAWDFYGRSLPRLQRDMFGAIRILEAKWDDSRQFAFHFFRTAFDGEDFSPEVLIAICDSVREDVQQLGRELITRTFQTDDGWTYLSRLSEHPSASLQLMASLYLEQYAVDQPERLAALTLYLVTVLSQVNRGRVAKERILNFLEQEGLKSEVAAGIIAEVLERQALTMAVSYRARMLTILVKLRRAWPGLALPIETVPIPLRSKASRSMDAMSSQVEAVKRTPRTTGTPAGAGGEGSHGV